MSTDENKLNEAFRLTVVHFCSNSMDNLTQLEPAEAVNL
jgi:hypothetical protein